MRTTSWRNLDATNLSNTNTNYGLEEVRVIKSVLVYALQVAVIAIVGYALWYLIYGNPSVPFFVWILICIGAGLLGLVPYLLGAFGRGRKGQ